MNRDTTKYAISNLVHRKTRSSLSILSIMLGIMSIFALVSFGQGLQQYIDTFAAELGTNKVIIQPLSNGPPGSSNFALTESDFRFISRINGVDQAAKMSFETAKVTFKDPGKAKYVYVAGYPIDDTLPLIEQFLTVKIEQGRQLKNGDVLKAVVGYSYQFPNKIFDNPVRLGDRLTINEEFDVEVVGFYEKVGNPSDDQNIYLTLDGIDRIWGASDEYAMIVVTSTANEDTKALADKIKDKLAKHRGEKKGQETFYAQTFEELIAMFSNIISGLNIALFVIALISLFVAAVNIANTMYTAVLERTKEIGILKAIGARNVDIAVIFLVEAGLLGIVGAALGIFLGFLIASAGGVAAAQAGYSLLAPVFPAWLIIGCLLFGLFVGAGAGLLPAIQASKQRPVDSLRYE
ncbi:MAG: ABC transporter permease [Nanoarchaeota archaeon]